MVKLYQKDGGLHKFATTFVRAQHGKTDEEVADMLYDWSLRHIENSNLLYEFKHFMLLELDAIAWLEIVVELGADK